MNLCAGAVEQEFVLFAVEGVDLGNREYDVNDVKFMLSRIENLFY